jgi:hypothetical protein
MILQRSDIVGHRILRVLQTPWITDRDNPDFAVEVCEVFVVLDSGVVFALCPPFDADNQLLPIETIDRDVRYLIPAELRHCDDRIDGQTIVEVVTAEHWPWFGLLLSDGKCLRKECPFGFSWTYVGAWLGREDILNDEHFSYWEQQPLGPPRETAPPVVGDDGMHEELDNRCIDIQANQAGAVPWSRLKDEK